MNCNDAQNGRFTILQTLNFHTKYNSYICGILRHFAAFCSILQHFTEFCGTRMLASLASSFLNFMFIKEEIV